ncbi:MAG: class I SAM-dependent methyltransferase [Candidatus Accumulibacter sp.]|uniref:class I SAM-dependent methyltransferase n=1 Tax=Accumulibacter sp. TaxID=2053492 RepID=UPI0019ECC5CD|nr:class I SAM-dependent methyltransferase [Accumulibacter sp.]MBE2259953.1 class I SAM-dependent methyltransferase [Paracoccaceae bacterium]MCB1940495.1 class I SAM-dependent methyltransferase [Accumulibacter sp.]MCP5248286.1 class I SAM-dependent methyltransferase [Accumulibacter sp.]
MSLKHSYTLISPFYDAALARASRAARLKSLEFLPASPARVLLTGVGTGLDLPLLPAQHRYTGIDLTHAMLRRALPRAASLDFRSVQGDAQCLPFADGSFDHAILHLILAVLPDPVACLRETARVLAPGGRVLIFDKFLQPGQRAPTRRLLNPLVRRVATRLDVVFEEVLAKVPPLRVVSDEAVLAGGWFRLIRLRRA